MTLPKLFLAAQKNLSCPKFGGAAAPFAPPARTPMETGKNWYEPPAPLTWILYGS